MDLQPNKIDGIVKPITNTRISASEWNQLVGSCMAFITAAGFTPDADDNQQFLNAFIQIAQNIGAVGANVDLSNLSATGEAKFTGKANTSLDNITSAAKGVILTTVALDYTTTISIGATTPGYWSPYQVPSDGVVMTNYTNAGMSVSTSSSQSDVIGTFGTCFLPVTAGQWVNVTVASGYTGFFVAYKGVAQ